jgi:hypothetical protein
MLASNARHLSQPGNRVCHEVNDELRQSCVERPVWKRQLLGRRTFHADPGMPLSCRRNERLRGIHSRYSGCPKPRHQLRCQGARAAANIEHALTDDHIRQICKLGSEQNGVAAHEPVIRVSGDGEAHERNLRMSAAQMRRRRT